MRKLQSNSRVVSPGLTAGVLLCAIALLSAAASRGSSAQPADTTPDKPQAAPSNPDEINERLTSRRVALKFDNVPLGEAVEFIGAAADVNTFIDWKSLEALGIEHDVPVTLKLRNPVSAGQALRLTLRSVNPALSYNVDEEVVVIAASAEQAAQPAAEAQLETRVYDVADLVGANGAGEALVQLVTQSVTPEAWDSQVGGPHMKLLYNRLVVVAPVETQDRISELLGKVRQPTPNGVPPGTDRKPDAK